MSCRDAKNPREEVEYFGNHIKTFVELGAGDNAEQRAAKLIVLLSKKSKAHAGTQTTVTTEHVISRNFGVSCLQPPHSKNCRSFRSRPAQISLFGSIKYRRPHVKGVLRSRSLRLLSQFIQLWVTCELS